MINWKAFIPFLNKGEDWHTPTTNLQIIRDEDLKKIKKDTMDELKKSKVIDPKALFYIHKYIDARFSEKDFDIEGRFLDKQNTLDQLYSLGRSEVYTMFTEYQEILKKAKEADKRYRRAIIAMDSKISAELDKKKFYDDVDLLKEEFDKLPQALDWGDNNEI